MTNLIEKARIGRMNALSGMAHGPNALSATPRNRIQGNHKSVAFISSRARASSESALL